jgi:hypothetical protein
MAEKKQHLHFFSYRHRKKSCMAQKKSIYMPLSKNQKRQKNSIHTTFFDHQKKSCMAEKKVTFTWLFSMHRKKSDMGEQKSLHDFF